MEFGINRTWHEGKVFEMLSTRESTATVGKCCLVAKDPAGFGMWRSGVPEYCWADVSDRHGDGQAEIDAFMECSRDNGFECEITNELDGLIYGQRGQLVKFWPIGEEPAADNTNYQQFWLEEARDDEYCPKEEDPYIRGRG